MSNVQEYSDDCIPQIYSVLKFYQYTFWSKIIVNLFITEQFGVCIPGNLLQYFWLSVMTMKSTNYMVILVAYCVGKKMEMESQDLDANCRTNNKMWDKKLHTSLFSKTRSSITSKIFPCPKIQGYPLIC